MLHFAKRLNVLTMLLSLMMMLSACSINGKTTHLDTFRHNPPPTFLENLSKEYSTGEYGPATKEVVKIYIRQNAPTEVLLQK